MQLGLIGLGKMGGTCASVCAWPATKSSATTSTPRSRRQVLAELVKKLEAPRIVWTMAAGQITRDTVAKLADLLEPGDLVIDGGNCASPTTSRTRNCSPRASDVDCGVSGGSGA